MRAPPPVWLEGLWVQGVSALLIVLAGHEWLAAGLGVLACGVRLWFALGWERRRFWLTLALGLCVEVALWRTDAIRYLSPAVAHVPLWILPLWGGGGLVVAGLAGGSGWRPGPRWLGLLPFVLLWLNPASWALSLSACGLAVLVAARGGWRPALLVLLCALGGSSASTSFGLAGVCAFPQAWYGIPSWGPGMWASLSVALVSQIEYPPPTARGHTQNA